MSTLVGQLVTVRDKHCTISPSRVISRDGQKYRVINLDGIQRECYYDDILYVWKP
jgi:hypothetical protein